MSKFRGDDAARLNDPDSWDESDIAYLRDRNMLPSGYKLPDDMRPSAPRDIPLEERTNVGDVDLLVEPEDPFMEEDDGIDIDSMNKSALQREARNRGIDDGGTVRELRERITAFDESTP
jgi:hypothetical protein